MIKAIFVIQRYGESVVGGGESLCRQVAEYLVQHKNWQITVLTTQSTDYISWRNDVVSRKETINGVSVQRFPVCFPRIRSLFSIANRLLPPVIKRLQRRGRLAEKICEYIEFLWLILQGPYCPSLIRYLKDNLAGYQKVFFFTYLYYPTLRGALSLEGLSYTLVPFAHDEPPLYFSHTRKLFRDAAKILVNLQLEKDLIEKSLKAHLPSIYIGGVGFKFNDSIYLENMTQNEETPFLLYLGRISSAKGIDQLLLNFRLYKNSRGAIKELKLVLTGKKDAEFNIPDNGDIHYLGFVTEEKKEDLFRRCLCVVNPSRFESLSLITIEAIMKLKPVLLNKECSVLEYYCKELETCFGYLNAKEFCDQLSRIINTSWHDAMSRKQLKAARTWANRQYSWDVVVEAYSSAPDLE